MALYLLHSTHEYAVRSLAARINFFLLILLALTGSSFSKEIPVVTSVIAFDMTTEVVRGGEVDVLLNAIPNYGNKIIFEIQKNPACGIITSPQNQSDHTALVTYHNDGKKGVFYDEFSFRVSSIARAKSIAYKVRIHIIPLPARLMFLPDAINFGNLLLGEKRQTNVTISNLGGSRAEGRLILPSGWSAPEGDGFSLDEGEQVKMLLEFSPMEEKSYAIQIDSLPHYNGGSLSLKGQGMARFEISKEDLLTCAVKNLSDQSLRFSFTGDAAWIMPPERVLPPHAEKNFSFQQAEHDADMQPSYSPSEVSISDGLSARVFELPPIQEFIPLTLNATYATELGQVLQGVSMPVVFSILNRSEMSKNARWIATSSSGGGMPAEIPFVIKGGGSQDFHFDWKPTLLGPATLKITVSEGTKTSHELLFHATVSAPVSTVPASVSEQPQGGDQSTQPAPEIAPMGKPLASFDELSWKAKHSWNGNNIIELQYDGVVEGGSTITVEEKVMQMKTQEEMKGDKEGGNFPMKLISLPIESSPPTKEGSVEVRELKRISPGWHLLMLSRFSKDGDLEAQSQIQVFIPSPKSWWSLVRVPLGMFFLILLAAFLWKQRS